MMVHACFEQTATPVVFDHAIACNNSGQHIVQRSDRTATTLSLSLTRNGRDRWLTDVHFNLPSHSSAAFVFYNSASTPYAKPSEHSSMHTHDQRGSEQH